MVLVSDGMPLAMPLSNATYRPLPLIFGMLLTECPTMATAPVAWSETAMSSPDAPRFAARVQHRYVAGVADAQAGTVVGGGCPAAATLASVVTAFVPS